MSSLLKPFSVHEGPCESSGIRRAVITALPEPPSLTVVPSQCSGARTDSSPVNYPPCGATRTLAAAAIGGPKITHPGKAILAGRFVILSACTIPPVFDPEQPHRLISSCRSLPSRTGSSALGHQLMWFHLFIYLTDFMCDLHSVCSLTVFKKKEA